METKLNELFAKREAALSAWDATAYNAADREISAFAAFMRAEANLGLRKEPIFTTSGFTA